MAKEKFNEEDGIWRTIGGRRVFIKNGQSLSDAMKESGKFKTGKKEEVKDHTFEMDEEDKKKYEEVGKKIDDLTKEIDEEKSKGDKINETMDKRQAIIKKLDKETEDLSNYDKYNLAVSKLEDTEGMTPTERQYWAGVRDNYQKNALGKQMKDADAKDIEENKNKKGVREEEYIGQDGKTHTMNVYDYPEDRDAYHKFLENKYGTYKEEEIKNERGRTEYKKLRDEFYKSQDESASKGDNLNYRDKITDVAKNSSEDNVTLDIETGKPVSFEKGYSVSFQQSTDNYDDAEYNKRVEECRNKCDGNVYAGKYGGDAEVSFHTDSLDDAKELMYKYNQESIYDWQHDTLIMNDKYDASKNKTNYNAEEKSTNETMNDAIRNGAKKNNADNVTKQLSPNSGQERMGDGVKVMRSGDDYIVLKNGHNEKEFSSQKEAEDYARTLTSNNAKESLTNEAMNEAIRQKASKGNDNGLPQRTEIKTQGTSNRKEVSENIQAHILDYYDSPEAFLEQMDNMNAPTKWHAGEELAKGGSYMIYYDDQREFLDSLKINPSGKKFSDDRVFSTYTSLVGRESAKLYDRLLKNAYKDYLKEHPGSNMSLDEFKKNRKK